MTDITMPRLSESMEEGTILRWLIQEGQPVAVGDELLDIETDKATMTHVSDAAGRLVIIVAEGETVPVGTVIARADATSAPAAGEGGTDEPIVALPDAAPAAAEIVEPTVPATLAGDTAATAGTMSVTPLARRIALSYGVSLASIAGSGPGGRVTRRDVLSAAGVDLPPGRSASASPPAAAPPPAAPPASIVGGGRATEEAGTGAKGAIEIQEMTRVQQVIARRMAEAKATVPDFQVQTEVEMNEAIALRASLKAIADGEAVPSFNDIIVKACAIALTSHPRANGSYRDGHFELHQRINIGIAVAAEDALVVPTLTDADSKSLAQIAAESRRLAERVRAGTITPPELSGATFTVSNLGMFGMTAITAVINSPQAAILGVGAVRETLARADDGEIVDRALLTLSLNCDHRILYGADAARLLSDIKGLIEQPLRLAL